MDSFLVSTDKLALQVETIHDFLCNQSTWARGIPLATVERSIENSLCFGGYLEGRQIAFARVISDFATFANLVDVFVLPEFRGKGYSRRLLEVIFKHPDLQGLRRFTLATSSAHGLYAKFGFQSLAHPDSFMEKYDRTIYESPKVSHSQ